MRAYRGSRSIAPTILNFGIRWREWSPLCLSRFTPETDTGPVKGGGGGCILDVVKKGKGAIDTITVESTAHPFVIGNHDN